jgi:hypothetical protein
MYTKTSSFFCGLCKNNKSLENIRKIMLYDIPENKITSSDLCALCFKQLYNICANRLLTEKNQTSLNKWSLEIGKE